MGSEMCIRDRRRASLFRALGNSSSEALVQSNSAYRIADPDVTVTREERTRGAGGALDDITPLAEDSASLTWLTINVIGSQVFKTQIDQRDVNYINPITIGSLRTAMTQDMVLWRDELISASLVRDVTRTVALPASGGATVSRSTGKLTGGNNSQRNDLADAAIDWFGDQARLLGIKNARPVLADGDILSPAVVMTSPLFQMIEDRFLALYGSTTQITITPPDQRPALFNRGEYRGEIRGLPVLVTNNPSIYPQDATSDVATELWRMLLLTPNNTFDVATATYPARTSEPTGDSAKYKLQQELEVWYGIVNPDTRGAFAQVTLPASD